MIAQFFVNDVCPTLGVIMANAVFMAPISSLKSAMISGSLGELNPLPWAFMTGNCIGWVAYSYLTKNPFVFAANAPGIFVSTWLNSGAIKLQYYANKAENSSVPTEKSSTTLQERAILFILFIWVTVLTIIEFIPMPHDQKEITVGIVVNLNLVVFFGAPLSTIATVFRLRDSSSIHRGTMLMSILNCSFWFIYGLAVSDVFISVPNGTGLILGLIQGGLYFGCPRKRSDGYEKEMVNLS